MPCFLTSDSNMFYSRWFENPFYDEISSEIQMMFFFCAQIHWKILPDLNQYFIQVSLHEFHLRTLLSFSKFKYTELFFFYIQGNKKTKI